MHQPTLKPLWAALAGACILLGNTAFASTEAATAYGLEGKLNGFTNFAALGTSPWTKNGRYFIDTSGETPTAYVIYGDRADKTTSVIQVPLTANAQLSENAAVLLETDNSLNPDIVNLAYGSPLLAQLSDGTLIGSGFPVINGIQYGQCRFAAAVDGVNTIVYGHLFHVDKSTLTTRHISLTGPNGTDAHPICPLSEMVVDAQDNLWFFSHAAGTFNQLEEEYRGQKLFRVQPARDAQGQLDLTSAWTLEVMREGFVPTDIVPFAMNQTRMPTRLFFSQDGNNLFAIDAMPDRNPTLQHGLVYRMPLTTEGGNITVGEPVIMHRMDATGDYLPGVIASGLLDAYMNRIPPVFEADGFLYGAFTRATDGSNSGSIWRLPVTAEPQPEIIAVQQSTRLLRTASNVDTGRQQLADFLEAGTDQYLTSDDSYIAVSCVRPSGVTDPEDPTCTRWDVYLWEPLPTGTYEPSELQTLFTFPPASESESGPLAGATPSGLLVQVGDKFYGTTQGGGTQDHGLIYAITPSAGAEPEKVTIEPDLFQFDAITTGRAPAGLFAQGTTLYTATTVALNAEGAAPLTGAADASGYIVALDSTRFEPQNLHTPPQITLTARDYSLSWQTISTHLCRLYQGADRATATQRLEITATADLRSDTRLFPESAAGTYRLACKSTDTDLWTWSDAVQLPATATPTPQPTPDASGGGSSGGSAFNLLMLLPLGLLIGLRRRWQRS